MYTLFMRPKIALNAFCPLFPMAAVAQGLQRNKTITNEFIALTLSNIFFRGGILLWCPVGFSVISEVYSLLALDFLLYFFWRAHLPVVFIRGSLIDAIISCEKLPSDVLARASTSENSAIEVVGYSDIPELTRRTTFLKV